MRETCGLELWNGLLWLERGTDRFRVGGTGTGGREFVAGDGADRSDRQGYGLCLVGPGRPPVSAGDALFVA